MTDTKEVIGYFGKPRQITREDFVQRWKQHTIDLLNLAADEKEYDEICDFIKRVEAMAGANWDRIKKREG